MISKLVVCVCLCSGYAQAEAAQAAAAAAQQEVGALVREKVCAQPCAHATCIHVFLCVLGRAALGGVIQSNSNAT